MRNSFPQLSQVLKGSVRIYPLANPKDTYYERKNVIVEGVSSAANETGNAAGMVLAAASNLSKQAEQLSGEVGTFLAGVRAA